MKKKNLSLKALTMILMASVFSNLKAEEPPAFMGFLGKGTLCAVGSVAFAVPPLLCGLQMNSWVMNPAGSSIKPKWKENLVVGTMVVGSTVCIVGSAVCFIASAVCAGKSLFYLAKSGFTLVSRSAS